MNDFNEIRKGMIQGLNKFYMEYNYNLSKGNSLKASEMLSDFMDDVSKMLLINKDFVHKQNMDYIDTLKALKKGEIIDENVDLVVFWTVTSGKEIFINPNDLEKLIHENTTSHLFGSNVSVGTGIINFTRYNYKHLQNMLPATYDSIKYWMKKTKNSLFVIDSSMDFDMFTEMLYITNKEDDVNLRKRIYVKTSKGLKRIDDV